MAGIVAGCAATSEEQRFTVRPNLVEAAKINVQLGLSFLEKNDLPQSKQKFLQAKQQAPKEPTVWYGMGYFLERTGDVQKAEAYYQKAISLNPQEGAAHNNYGTFLCRQGRYRESLKQFELAVADENYLDVVGVYRNVRECAVNKYANL